MLDQRTPVFNGSARPEQDNIPRQINPFAFRREVANEIKERDGWRCECGRGGKVHTGGYRLHASHIDHDKRNPYYNNPDNGKTLCIGCHLHDHLGLFRNCSEEDYDWAYHSVRLLAKDIWENGMHTKPYYQKNGLEVLVEDRKEMLAKFEFWGLEVGGFVDLRL